jgi:hypothetical protein
MARDFWDEVLSLAPHESLLCFRYSGTRRREFAGMDVVDMLSSSLSSNEVSQAVAVQFSDPVKVAP